MFFWKAFFILGITIQGFLNADSIISFSSATSIYRNANVDVIDAQLALHPTNFSALVVWVSSVSGSYQIEGSFFNGSSWSSAAVLGVSETQPSPKVKIDANGNGIAIWDAFDGTDVTLQVAQFNGTSWASGTTLQNLGTTEYNPMVNIAMNKKGFAVASWLTQSLTLMGSTYSPDTESWSASYPISQAGIPLSATVMAPTLLDSNNQLTAILPLATQLDTVVFDALNPPAAPTNAFLRLVVVEAASNNISQYNANDMTAFFVQDRLSNYLISATRNGSNPWSFLLAGNLGFPAADISFALNPLNNRLGVIWALEDGIIQASFYNFVSWQFVTLLSSSGSSPAATFYQNTSDRFVVIWDDHTEGDGNHAIYYSEYDTAANIWSFPAPISQRSAFTGSAQLAALPNGQAIAVWTRTDTTVGPTPRKILEAALGSPE